MTDDGFKAALFEMEDRLVMRIEKSRAALEKRIIARVDKTEANLEERLLSRIEKTETNLLGAFPRMVAFDGGPSAGNDHRRCRF